MKVVTRQILLAVLMLTGALALTKTLYAWPDLLPSGLRTLGNMVVEAVGAGSAESISDIELAYIFLISLLVICLIFFRIEMVDQTHAPNMTIGVHIRCHRIEEDAWAPHDLDPELWRRRMLGINPFVAERDGQILGYADLQSDGYIDHFFVSGHHPRAGIGTALMHHLINQARALGLRQLTSDVSRTAQSFYEKFGFSVVEHRQPVVRGVIIPNAFMRRCLD